MLNQKLRTLFGRVDQCGKACRYRGLRGDRCVSIRATQIRWSKVYIVHNEKSMMKENFKLATAKLNQDILHEDWQEQDLRQEQLLNFGLRLHDYVCAVSELNIATIPQPKKSQSRPEVNRRHP